KTRQSARDLAVGRGRRRSLALRAAAEGSAVIVANPIEIRARHRAPQCEARRERLDDAVSPVEPHQSPLEKPATLTVERPVDVIRSMMRFSAACISASDLYSTLRSRNSTRSAPEKRAFWSARRKPFSSSAVQPA